jgi:uncharacterized OB-fold protein
MKAVKMDKIETKEPMIVHGKIILPYTHSVGHVGSKFLVELRDNKSILAIRCPACNRVYVPPRSTCTQCFAQLEDWVELDGPGTLTTYTVIHYSLPVHPVKAPFALGIIHLDGADTGLIHIVGETEMEKLSIGLRVRPVFKEKREGSILDIKYFRPLSP